MREKLLLCLIFIALTPSIASATDYTGILTLMLLVYIMIPGMIINLIVVIVLAVKRRYASLRFALTHSCIVSAVIIGGALLTLQQYSYRSHAQYLTGARNAALQLYAGLLVLAWLPMLLHVLTLRRAPAGHAS